jgi:hypothetical protein
MTTLSVSVQNRSTSSPPRPCVRRLTVIFTSCSAFCGATSFRLAVFHTGRRGGKFLFPGAEPGVDIGGSEAPAGVQTDRAGEFAGAGTAVDPATAATKLGGQLVGIDEVSGGLRLHDYIGRERSPWVTAARSAPEPADVGFLIGVPQPVALVPSRPKRASRLL